MRGDWTIGNCRGGTLTAYVFFVWIIGNGWWDARGGPVESGHRARGWGGSDEEPAQAEVEEGAARSLEADSAAEMADRGQLWPDDCEPAVQPGAADIVAAVYQRRDA